MSSLSSTDAKSTNALGNKTVRKLAPSHKRRWRRRLLVEQLEARWLLAASRNLPEALDLLTITEPQFEVSSRLSSVPSAAMDSGDFYWVGDRPVQLLQLADERVVRLAPGAVDISGLTAESLSGLILDGWGVSGSLGDLAFLKADLGAGVLPDITAPLDSLSDAISDGYLVWQAPVFVDPISGLRQIVTDEIIVALDGSVAPQDYFATELFAAYRPLRGTPDQFVATLAGGGTQALMTANQLHQQGEGVQWVSPNFLSEIRKASVTDRMSDPDPLLDDQWHLRNTGQNQAKVGADAKVLDAWELLGAWTTPDATPGSPEIIIAIFDDGVQTDHPDLAIWVNPFETENGEDSDGNGWVDDVHGLNIADGNLNDATWGVNDDDSKNDPNPVERDENHGTAVAGVAAATGLRVAGAAPGVQVMPIKIFYVLPSGDDDIEFTNTADLASAIYYAAGRTADGNGTWRGADIGNHSYGLPGEIPHVTVAFDWAAKNGRGGLGMANFVATGNSASGLKEFKLSGFSEGGNYVVEWRYTKDDYDVVSSGGSDTSWLAAVSFPGGTIETFTSANLPSGWSTSGDANWTIVNDSSKSYVGLGSDLSDSYIARAGTITHNQSSVLRSSSFSAGGSLKYWVDTSIHRCLPTRWVMTVSSFGTPRMVVPRSAKFFLIHGGPLSIRRLPILPA